MVLALTVLLVFTFRLSLDSESELEVSASEGGGERSPETWTVLSYMNGDGNLERFITGDMKEMEMIGSSDRVNIIVQIDLGTYLSGDPDETWTDTRRYRVENHPDPGFGSTRLDGEGSLPELGEVDMDDPDSLKDFLMWGLSNYPADHYMIAIEGHADGPANGLMQDDTSGGSDDKMYAHEMGEAIRTAIDSTIDQPVDIISFDVCWMGMAEAAAEIMDHADYMFGSFDEIPGAGWPYDRCLGMLLNDTSMPLEERLTGVVKEYMDHYDPEGSNSYMSLAAIDLKEFKNSLLPPIKDLGSEIFYTHYDNAGLYNSVMPLINNPRKKDDNRWDRYIDLYQFAEILSMDSRFPERVREAAYRVLTTEEGVLIHSDGGSNHPPSSRLFGIYYPTIRNQQSEYSPLVLSDISAWDELAALRVENLHLEARRLNWTSPEPSTVTFELISMTPSLVDKVELYTVIDGVPSNHTIVGAGGVYLKTIQLSGAESVSYRYEIRGKYGNVVDLPPDGSFEARFETESNPPEIWHRIPQTVSLSPSSPGLTFFIRDQTGIETVKEDGRPRLEYRQAGNGSWYSIPLAERDEGDIRGWLEFGAIPSGLESGIEIEYHILVSDIYGNQARFPESGEAVTVMAEGKRFYLDSYRSMLLDHSLLVERFSALGMSLDTGLSEAIPDLSDHKGYILIQPQKELENAQVSKISAFHQAGGEILLVIDPNSPEQIINARRLLEILGADITSEGSVNGFYPSSTDSDLGDDLPSVAGNCEGSIVMGEEMNPVYYTTPPFAALATGWYGKGKSVITVPSLFNDQVMELDSNRMLSEMVISFLQENSEPVIVHSIEPSGVLIPDQVFRIDLTDSFDRDGTIETYSVTFSDNTHISGPDPVFNHSFESTGSFTAVIEVIDLEGAASSRTISFKVNRPPGTEMGVSETTIHSGDTVVFDYKGKDPDGDDIYVLWEFGDGFKVSGQTVSHTYNMRGSYTFRLIVRDSNGLERNRTGTIIVENSEPVAVIDRESIRVNSGPANFTGSTMVTLKVREGDQITIPGDQSYDDDAMDQPNLTWDMGDGSMLYGKKIIHTYRTEGLFEVVLTVDDGYGGRSNTTLEISVENRAPFAVFTAEDLGGGKFSLDASLSTDDPWDVETLTYIWDLGDGNTKRTNEPVIEYRYSFGGTFDVELRVEDSDGDSDSYEREVEVDGLTFIEVMAISLVTLLILGTAGVVGVLYMRRKRRMSDDRDDTIESGISHGRGSGAGFRKPRPAREQGPSSRSAMIEQYGDETKSSSSNLSFDRR